MAQSSLYKIGQGQVASTVDVTSDDQRDIGITSVSALNDSVDITDRSNRSLGNTQVTNTVDARITSNQDPLDVSAATVAVQEDTPLDVSAATVAVQEDTPLDVSAAPLDVSGSEVVNTAKALQHLSNGNMRLASTGQISVSDNLNIMLENPSGSGVKLTVVGIIAANDAGQVTFPTLHFNPTTDTPTTARTITDPNLGTSAASNANLYADDMANEMSGGSEEMTFGVEGGRTEIEAYVALAPDTSIGVSNPFSGLTSANATFTGWFIEEPL